jgi:hypothetical protein
VYKQILLSAFICICTLNGMCQDVNIYDKSKIEFELLPIKKMLINSGPVQVDSLVNLIGDRHQFIGFNVLGRGWYYNEYVAELRKVYTGSSRKVVTLVLETRIYSKEHAMILWVGNLTLTLRDGSTITESVGAPPGSWPPAIKE